MTFVAIALFSLVNYLSRGHYDPSAPVLTLVFLIWVYWRIFRPLPLSESPRFFRYYPWFCVLLSVVKPGPYYVAKSMKGLYQVWRGVPLSFNLLPKKVLPWVVLAFLTAVVFISPDPSIDVFRSNTLGVDFFLKGLNPYSQSYPDLYQGEFDYVPGFLYWPMALYLQTLSRILFGDIRIILILSWFVAPFLFPRRHAQFHQLRLMWWTIPLLAFGLEEAWLDPILAASATLLLWSAKRKSDRIALIAAVFAIVTAASVKQYGFIIGFFFLLQVLARKEWKEFWKISILSAIGFGMVMLPFVIWNFHDFYQMTVGSHTTALVRKDSLNFTAFWLTVTGQVFPGWFQAGMTAMGFFLAGFHVFKNGKRRGLSVVPESWAIAFGFAVMFGKFAFFNYHWLLVGFWILSSAFEDADKAPL